MEGRWGGCGRGPQLRRAGPRWGGVGMLGEEGQVRRGGGGGGRSSGESLLLEDSLLNLPETCARFLNHMGQVHNKQMAAA